MKTDIKKILVPTDFSETASLALEHASLLTRLLKADLIIVHVLPLTPYYFEIPEPVMWIDNQEEVEKIVQEKLSGLVKKIQDSDGISARFISARGVIANEIIQLAQEEKA